MTPSEPTERQDDSAVASDVASRLSGHVRGVYPFATTARVIGPEGATLGRATGEADVVFDDAHMSRRHARILREAMGWRLVDQGSRNGGFVDGIPLAPHGATPLRDGAVIRLGGSLLVFRACPPPADDGDRDMFPGVSPVAIEVRARIRRLAAAPGHMLVLGETGTGKERASRALGGSGAFIPVNCAELSRELARSDLFGHVRGAFSGATATKQGLVEAAAGGVLFLDELGELPLDVQGELLRFLEDGKYRVMGVPELRFSNARVVGATNVDLETACTRGGFRRDLLARLRASNAPLHLPPLRERREDILAWADYFLAEVGVGAGIARVWEPGAAECLMLYTWPDNLRGLRGAVREIAAAEPSWPLTSRVLPERIQAHRKSLRAPHDEAAIAVAVAAPVAVAPTPTAPDPTREQIIEALTRLSGRMLAVSEDLGVERRKLYRLCAQYGIDFGSYRPTASPREED